MFRQTKNIDTAFRQYRLFSLIIIAGAIFLSCFIINKSYKAIEQSQQRVLILLNGQVLEAFATKRKDNIPVIAKHHIEMFHYYFFTLDPDEKVIQENINKALYLADETAKIQYDNLKESGYYTNVIGGNISQRVYIDSITVDINQSPYSFICYGTERIVRPSSIVTRTLITQGYLRDVKQSENNPQGFLIEKWKILENKDLKTEKR